MNDGFITKEEWVEKGRDPELWRSEEEFKKRGEEILPIVNANNKKLTQHVEDLKSDISKVIDFNEKQAEQLREEGYQKALKEIADKKKIAFEGNDYNEIEKLDDKKDKLVEKHHADKPKPKEEKKADPEFDQFSEDNKDWFGSDEEMTEWANSAGAGIAEAAINKGKTRAESFELVTKEVKARFPDKFKNPNREKPGAVEGDAGSKNKSSNGKGWNDLPDSAKTQFKRIQDQMKLKGREYKKEDYVANYEF